MVVTLCGRVALGALDGSEVVLSRPQVQLGFAALVLERHRPMPSAELAHVLWGDDLSPHWAGALRGVLAKLRTALDAAGLPRTALSNANGLVQLHLDATELVDVERARAEVVAAERHLQRGEPAAAAGVAQQALEVLDRGFLPNLDHPWADARRRELDEVRRRAARLRAQALLDVGAAGEAAEVVERLLVDDPFDDDARALELEALARSGGPEAARRAFERYTELLRRELDVGPSDRLRTVLRRVADEGGDGAPVVLDLRQVPTPGAPPTWDPGPAAWPFVGRRALLDQLVASARRQGPGALEGAGLRVVVVEGEPGVGKTRLAGELAATVDALGLQVLWGRCSPHGSLPFEPVAGALAPLLGPGGPAATRPDAPTLRGALGLPGAHPGPEGRAARDRVFAGVVDVVRVAAHRPLLWVVDDLQWASPDALALLTHVGEALLDRPVTLVATCRERPTPVAAALAHLARRAPLEVHQLEGLDVGDIGRWLHDAEVREHPGLPERVRARTGGNPLYVGHLVRAAQEVGGELDPDVVPVELQAYLEQRIDALDVPAALLLGAVAVAEHPSDVDLLGEVTGLDRPPLFDATGVLLRARLVAEGTDGLQVAHAVVHDAVLERLGPGRRRWLHGELAAGLERRPPAPGVAGRIAHHLRQAGRGGTTAALGWQVRAAEEALDQGAWAGGRALALDVLGGGVADPALRTRALVALGRGCRGLGDREGAEAALDEALELARVHGLRRERAEVVLAMVGGGGRGVPDRSRHRRAALVEEALAGLGEHDDDLRVPLLGSLAVSLLLTDRDEERRSAADEALERARHLGDRALLARALLDHRFRLGPDAAPVRLREAEEALALARAVGLPEVVAAALVYRHEDLLVLGDRPAADVALAEADAHLADHPDPYWGWAARTWRVLGRVLDGDLDGAEACADEALALALDEPEAVACFGVNLVLVRVAQGRPDEVLDLLDRAVGDAPEVPCYQAVRAYARALAGARAGAQRDLDALAGNGFAAIPDDTNRLLALAMLAEAAVELGAHDATGELRRLLQPYDGRYVVLNCYGGGGAVWGPVSAQLAALARLGGDVVAADRLASDARALAARVGDRMWLQRLEVVGATER